MEIDDPEILVKPGEKPHKLVKILILLLNSHLFKESKIWNHLASRFVKRFEILGDFTSEFIYAETN